MTNEERERLAAARHLRVEDRKTVARLTDLLGHDEYDVAASAAERLFTEVGKRAEPRLLALLRNSSGAVQARALAGEALSRIQSHKGAGAVLRIARDPREDLDLRRLLAECAGYSRDEKALKPLVSLTLKADFDLTLRSAAVQSIGDLGQPSLDFLERLALDPTAEPELRVATVLVLGGSGAERVRPILNELARGRDAPPRRQLSSAHLRPWRVRHAAAAAREQLNRDRRYGPNAHNAPDGTVRVRDPLFLPYPPRQRVSYAGPEGTGTQFELHTRACLGSRQDTRTVAAHYNRKFVQAGWRQQAGRISTDMAWSEWTFSSMSFPEATVRFQLTRTLEAPDIHELELDADWRPLRRLETARRHGDTKLDDES